jgi:hypothetical protein
MNEVPEWPAVCIRLLQGPVYEDDGQTWKNLLLWQSRIAEYVAVIGLGLFVDSGEGYAFLFQAEDENGETVNALPRLIRKMPLTFEMSLLCVILREALEQFDTSQNESRVLVMKASEIKEMLSVYLKEKTDQTRLYRELDRYLNQAAEMSFLRELKNERPETARSGAMVAEREFEVRRILRAKVDTLFLEDFRRGMEAYIGGDES